MDQQRERDELSRMQLTVELERSREIVTQYEVGMVYHRNRIENARYNLGKLDERLGGTA